MEAVAHSPSRLLAEVDSKREGGVAMLVEMLIGLHVGLCFSARGGRERLKERGLERERRLAKQAA